MKKSVLLCFSFFYVINCFSQRTTLFDSLNTILKKAGSDSERVRAMYYLGYNYQYINADSSMFFAQKALALSKEIGYAKFEVGSRSLVGNVLSNTGNFSEALQIFFEDLQTAEKLADLKRQGDNLINIGICYNLQGDYSQAIKYSFRALSIIHSLKDTSNETMVYLNLGEYFLKNKQPDSALVYNKEAFKLNVFLNDPDFMENIFVNLGNVEAQLGKDASASNYYQKALVLINISNNSLDMSNACLGVAKLYSKAGKKDSALIYANRSYAAALQGSFPEGMLNASTFLSSLYETINSDSALFYLKQTIAIKERIFNEERLKKVQSLTFSEQIRQQKIQEAKEKAIKDQQINMQMAGIAVFIILFISALVMMNHKHTNPKLLNFLGTLGLLML